MENKLHNKKNSLIILIIFLFVAVVLTTSIYIERLQNFLLSDEGAIDIADDDTLSTDNKKDEEQKEELKPGMQISDKDKIWSSKTDIEIFNISYSNGEGIVTVRSDGGDKLIAPGTDSSYTFKLKNTGNVALDYTVKIEAVLETDGHELPVEYRISRFDRKWIDGSKDRWDNISSLKNTKDTYTLGQGRYAWYTLDWRWLFDSGNDELDTLLGDLASEKDISLSIRITTQAVMNENPDYVGGILVATGDDSQLFLYSSLAGASMMLILILLYKKEKDDAKNA